MLALKVLPSLFPHNPTLNVALGFEGKMKTKEKNRVADNGNITPQLPPPARIQEAVELPVFKLEKVNIQVVGITPLIVHNWSEKAIRMMLGKQTGEAQKTREKKDPFADFESSLYPLPGGKAYGVPAPAFKACAVTAANSVQLKMTSMRQAFHVSWYTVPIKGEPITTPLTEWDEKYADRMKKYHALGISMRMDVVRLETGVADLRFRAWYPKWSAELEVEYNSGMISLAQLINLIRAGGQGCGICEWRPSAPQCRSGEFGRFDVR